MQGAVIRMRGDKELTQAIADGMTGVELRRAQEELARQALELTEARTALEGYEELKREAEGLRSENARLKTEVEMLRWLERKYIAEKVERLDAERRSIRPAPLWVRACAKISIIHDIMRGVRK